MPCMGPDYNHAVEKADKAFEEVMKLLNEKYGILPVGNTSGVFSKQYEEARQKVRAELKNLFWIDACDGF